MNIALVAVLLVSIVGAVRLAKFGANRKDGAYHAGGWLLVLGLALAIVWVIVSQ